MKNIFLIAGNPDVFHFYNQLKTEIEEATNCTCDYSTTCLQLADNLSPEEYFDKILQHHVEEFKQRKYTKPVSIIGHSIGAYFALKLLELIPQKIDKVMLLFPFLGEGDHRANIKLHGVYFFTRKVPVLNTLIRNKKFFEVFKKELKFVSQEQLRFSAQFAANEHLFFKSNKFEPSFKYREKVLLFFNETDKWCSQACLNNLRKNYSSHHINSPHDFVRYKKERLKVITEIRKRI